jgi:hypothetical protein
MAIKPTRTGNATMLPMSVLCDAAARTPEDHIIKAQNQRQRRHILSGGLPES